MTPSRKTLNSEPELSSGDIEETDLGPPKATPKGPRDPVRRCIATGDRLSQSQMVRFVRGPDDGVVPDVAARLPGRGAWVQSDLSALKNAISQNAFSRAFKKRTAAADTLLQLVENRLAQRCLDLLGFGRRAGDLILGFDQVREEIRRARPACLVEASDGSADGRSKLVGLAKALYLAGDDESGVAGGSPPIVSCFCARELGMALGRDRVIHGVVKQGRFAQTWTVEVARLSGFRPTAPDVFGPGTDR